MLLTLSAISAFGTVRYVDVNSTNATPPATNWATAATKIQDAIDVATTDYEVVVTNGMYATGGKAEYGTMTNRVAVYKRLTLRGVNGPESTVIQGYQVPGTTNGDGAVRCAYLTNGASLSGFTLTNGATRSAGDLNRERRGGGVHCESASAVVSNCLLIGNAAIFGGGGNGGAFYQSTFSSNFASDGGAVQSAILNDCILSGNSASGSGGGANSGTMSNCTFSSNSAGLNGGGAYQATLNNCIVSSNSASYGGGAFSVTLNNCIVYRNSATYYGGGALGGTQNNCTLITNSAGSGGGVYSARGSNCIVYYNTATIGANCFPGPTFNYCCTTPMPNSGLGNITNAPAFIDQAGNVRLQSTSPCINAGNNASAPAGPDLDDNPRIVNGTVDIGAYEFQGSGSLISYAWLRRYGWPTDGSADLADPDGDGKSNWQEWRCLTDPTNVLSVLRLLSAAPGGSNVTVSWQGVAGVNYFLERSTNLTSPIFESLATNLASQAGITTFTHTNATGAPASFYRVGVP